jgi:DNA repair protein RadA/Sms
VVRPVAQAAARLKEAQKLGFARAVLPESARGEAGDPGIALSTVDNLASLVADIAARSPGRSPAKLRRQEA